jgi:hypothetical protein
MAKSEQTGKETHDSFGCIDGGSVQITDLDIVNSLGRNDKRNNNCKEQCKREHD